MNITKYCEAKAGFNNIEFSDELEGIDEWAHSWPVGEILYRLNNLTGDISKESHQHRAVTVSLRAWQLRINKLKFRRERNQNVAVDFDVLFAPLENFDGMKGILAHAWYPGQGKISGDVEINDEWNWTTASKFQTLSRPPLIPILIHEFGYSLGLRHDTLEKQSIMYPSFNLGEKKNRLHTRDISRIQDKEEFKGYGARTISQRMIDYFQRRRDMAWDFD